MQVSINNLRKTGMVIWLLIFWKFLADCLYDCLLDTNRFV